MFEDLQRSYNWVLGTYEYADGDSLISNLPKVIAPADKMAEELRRGRLTAERLKLPLNFVPASKKPN